MKRTIERDHFAVFDDALPGEVLDSVNRWLGERAALQFINAVDLTQVWSVADGRPLRSPAVAVEVQRGRDGLRPSVDVPALDGPNVYGYPSDCPVDRVLDWLLEHAGELEPWVGEPLAEWKVLNGTGYVYPYGTGLEWHADGPQYTGSFVLYVHPAWKPRWGGEFLVADPPFEPDSWPETGNFIVPRPNRLVVVRGGTPHKVNKVSPLAGENFRRSITGFFDRRTVTAMLDEQGEG